MVKKGEKLGPRGELTKDGRPRQPPGRKPPPPDIRGERLVLRVHPDVIEILTRRARERGVSRSQYVERLVLGWIKADPRNPTLDAIGKRTPKAVQPADLKRLSPHVFGQRWARFEQISDLLLEETPKKSWLDEELPADFWEPEPTDDERERSRELGSEPDHSDEPTHDHRTLNPYRKGDD
jgi:hypothetical protein